MPRVLQRYALTGLFLIFALFAVVLAATAFVGYGAAKRAARDVLFGRGLQAAMSFTRAARDLRLHDSPALARELADEIGRGEIGIAVVDRTGKVLAASRRLAPKPGTRVALGARLQLRMQTRVGPPELDSFEDGPWGRALVLWRPIHPGPPRGPPFGPPGHRRGFRSGPPWARPAEPGLRRGSPGFRPPPRGDGDEPEEHPGPPPPRGPAPDGTSPAPGWGSPDGRSPPPPPRLFVRVVVPTAIAAPVLSPARNTLVMAMISSPLFLLAGILLLLGARRAQRAEREAQRRQALSALGEMSAVLAHEIRTPLASIKGNAQLIGEERGGDERVTSMVSECARLERLVNGLLDYARPVPPRRERCDPDRIAARTAEIVIPKAQAAGVGLLLDPCGCGEILFADTDQVLQALVNLTQNAIEATLAADRRDPIVLRVRKTGSRIVFSVLDRGPGFGGRVGEEIFKPFHSTRDKGTGLGLAVARQIAAQHLGTLSLVDREDGPGARADLTIPLESSP